MTGMLDWVIEAWGQELKNILHMMTMEDYEIVRASDQHFTKGLWWEQRTNVAQDQPILVGAPAETWHELGSRTLAAAGSDLVEQSAARGTYLEIIQQAFSGLVRAITGKVGRTVECGSGSVVEGAEPKVSGTLLELRAGELTPLILLLHIPAALIAALEGPAEPKFKPSIAPSLELQTIPPPLVSSAGSGTADLLMQVELPVSISFGRSILPLRDVLRLMTGSILELDRHLDEPVEVIVNRRVIAKGEVVTVAGNYGVRITEILNGQQQLAAEQGGRRPALPRN